MVERIRTQSIDIESAVITVKLAKLVNILTSGILVVLSTVTTWQVHELLAMKLLLTKIENRLEAQAETIKELKERIQYAERRHQPDK